MELSVWRVSLPVLRRALTLERLIRLTAAPSDKTRDVRLEQLSVKVAALLWRRSDGPCLERSVALHRVLGRVGANPTLVCGMIRTDVGLIGHAWVEADGRPMIDGDDPNGMYTIIARYSVHGRRLAR